MLFHSFLVGGVGADWAWLQRYGWMGVDLFFVLSGYLIGSQVLKPLADGRRFSFREFYLRRAFRILPAFWAVLAVYLLWPGFREAPGMEPWWKFVGFFLNLSIDYGRNAAFSHAWSLCVEEHFYLVFPLLAWLLAKRPSVAGFVALCAAIVIGGIVLRTSLWLHFDALQPARNWFVEDIYYPTWNRLDGLLAGVILAVWKTYRPGSWARVAEMSLHQPEHRLVHQIQTERHRRQPARARQRAAADPAVPLRAREHQQRQPQRQHRPADAVAQQAGALAEQPERQRHRRQSAQHHEIRASGDARPDRKSVV